MDDVDGSCCCCWLTSEFFRAIFDTGRYEPGLPGGPPPQCRPFPDVFGEGPPTPAEPPPPPLDPAPAGAAPPPLAPAPPLELFLPRPVRFPDEPPLPLAEPAENVRIRDRDDDDLSKR